MLAATYTRPPQHWRRAALAAFGQSLSLQEAKQRLTNFINSSAFDAMSEDDLSDFDVVFDKQNESGVVADLANKLIIIHGITYDEINEAAALAGAGGVFSAAPADSALQDAIRQSTNALIVPGTLGNGQQVLGLAAAFINILDNQIKTAPNDADTEVPVTPMALSTTSPTAARPSAAAVAPITRTQARAIARGVVINPSARPISTGATIAFAGAVLGIVAIVLVVKNLRR